MRRLLIGALSLGAALLATDALFAPWVVHSELVASLLSPGGLMLGRAAAALGYLALHLAAVFLGPSVPLRDSSSVGELGPRPERQPEQLSACNVVTRDSGG